MALKFQSIILLYVLAVVLWCTNDANTVELRSHNLERRATNTHLQLTTSEKELILNKHNELRRIVSPSAANMLKMSWNDDLERLASDYTKKCIYEHNEDRKLDGFTYVGENLYISMGRKIDENYGPGAVVAWDDEKRDYSFDTLTCTPGKVCGHYTQVVWAQSYKVGCGMTTCESVLVDGKIWTDATLFACNYAPGGNIRGYKPYIKGTSCSQCDDQDVCVDKLCSNPARGDVNIEDTTTIQHEITYLHGNMSTDAPTKTSEQSTTGSAGCSRPSVFLWIALSSIWGTVMNTFG
uniref:GLIPR1-like protein 1 n=1 Tax=Styela clava TaxID=7725 RepID=UPI001939AE6A|nr:GLIPR1-like protein 1 [Styela clava]